jgi:hypothetical protein
VRIGNYDLPQPDVTLLRPQADFYSSRKATPSDVLLLVEVSDSTLRRDLGRKARSYAAAGINEYWVIDLRNRVLYVHRGPEGAGYASRSLLSVDDHLGTTFAPEQLSKLWIGGFVRSLRRCLHLRQVFYHQSTSRRPRRHIRRPEASERVARRGIQRDWWPARRARCGAAHAWW